MNINIRVKQQRYTMTGSKIKRGLLPNIKQRILFRERRKKYVDFRKNSFDDFRLMIVDPPPKLDSDESDFLSSCYGPSMENQSFEAKSKMVLTHLLMHWKDSKTQSHPISSAMSPL